MSETNWLEIFGYVASVITGVSLMMSSIIRLRWLNLLGAFCFGTYGLLLGAWPVVALNYFICCINVYYLRKIYGEKVHFHMLESSVTDKYLNEFVKLHDQDIRTFMPDYKMPQGEAVAMMIHRDLALVGVFVGHKTAEDTLEVDLDYALPQYRDLKPAQFIYSEGVNTFRKQGIRKIVSKPGNQAHAEYLKKVGFAQKGQALELSIA